MRVAVVGAGISGLTCANLLTQQGIDATVFEKSRGSSGRASTRRLDDVAFDHGAQYFTVRDHAFQATVDRWLAAGVVAEWDGRIVSVENGVHTAVGPRQRYVGVPGMSSIGRHLARGLDVRLSQPIQELARAGRKWVIIGADGRRHTDFDRVVLSAPAPQTRVLADGVAPDIAAHAARVDFAPCWAVFASFEQPLPVAFDGAFCQRSALSWIARNSSKPGRAGNETWVLHGSPDWSREHFDDDTATVTAQLSTAFAATVGENLPAPATIHAHRWAYALPPEPLPERALLDRAAGIAACGDWCGGPRVEGAYLSGLAAARLFTEE
ncbi:MAG: FAD-dependent oxidoreductase [Planctomycetota bacterium]